MQSHMFHSPSKSADPFMNMKDFLWGKDPYLSVLIFKIADILYKDFTDAFFCLETDPGSGCFFFCVNQGFGQDLPYRFFGNRL